MSPALVRVFATQSCKVWDQQLYELYELSSYKADVTVLLFTGKKLGANL